MWAHYTITHWGLLFPRLLTPPVQDLSPDWWTLGVSPTHEVSFLSSLNRFGSPIGMSGIVPATTFDLPQFAATFLTILYGPIEGCIGVDVGFALIRRPLFSGWLSPINLLSVCFNDGAIYAIGGVFYRKYIHPWPTQKRLTLGLASYVILINFLHAGWFIPGLYWGWWGFILNGSLGGMAAEHRAILPCGVRASEIQGVSQEHLTPVFLNLSTG